MESEGEIWDETFEIRKETYGGQQYNQIYFTRLHVMRTLLYSLVPNLKPHLPVCKILGLEKGKACSIVGTLYKHMKLKPSILDEYSKTRFVTPHVKPHNFMHPDDHLILKDESGRVNISGVNVEKFDDKYFAKESKEKKSLPQEKKDNQKAVDTPLIKSIETVPELKAYLGSRLSLRAGTKPHEPVF
ncbi:hypothetical protein LWI28_013212 [Acer negundo]|uniref:DNA polymerase delta subunit OB-fold domain-containing protein n=1 Tax=Acer negundo TaxID=4023 RepID=A0AAD5J4R5_ACENE|nr:hypothetical protein LWI28_013212 [Acer negundo]